MSGLGVSQRAIITRTNDTNGYGAGDVVGAATGSTAAISFAFAENGPVTVKILSTQLEIDSAALIASETSYTLQCYSETPPSALGDNAAWDIPSGDRASYIGSFALGTPVDIGASLFIAVDGINKNLFLPTGVLYAFLTTAGGYTPVASRIYRVRLIGELV